MNIIKRKNKTRSDSKMKFYTLIALGLPVLNYATETWTVTGDTNSFIQCFRQEVVSPVNI